MLLVSLKVKDMLVYKKDLVLLDFQEKLTEDSEELDVLVHGIHLMFFSLLLDQDNLVIITEPKWIKKSTELVLQLKLIDKMLKLISI